MSRKKSGFAGLAKIWAPTEKALNRVMAMLEEAEKRAAEANAEAAESQQRACMSLAAQAASAQGSPSFAEAAAGLFPSPMGAQSMSFAEAADAMPKLGTVGNVSPVGAIGSGPTSPQLNVHQPQLLHSLSVQAPTKTFASALKPQGMTFSGGPPSCARGEPPGFESPVPKGPAGQDFASSAVIHWPHQSLRFIFLEESIKLMLSTLIMEHREHRVKITTPYRDKKDASVCMLIEESEGCQPGLVDRAAHDVEKFMLAVTQNLQFVYVVVSVKIYDNLCNRELSAVKELQGSHGVHIVMEPTVQDLRECTHVIVFKDLAPAETPKDSNMQQNAAQDQAGRSLSAVYQPFIPNIRFGGGPKNHEDPSAPPGIPLGNILGNLQEVAPGESGTSDSKSQHPLLWLQVQNPARRWVDVWVVHDETSAGFDFGVPAVLLVLDTNADASLQPTEIDLLQQGQALVNTDAKLGQTMLRVRPKLDGPIGSISPDSIGFSPVASPDSVSRQKEALVQAIIGGLRTADRMQLPGIAIVAPVFNSVLPALTAHDVSIETANAVMRFTQHVHTTFIRKIVCMEMDIGVGGNGSSAEHIHDLVTDTLRITQADQQTEAEAEHNLLALTMLKRWNDEQCPDVRYAQNSGTADKSIELVECNMPLPHSLQLAMPSKVTKMASQTANAAASSVVKPKSSVADVADRASDRTAERGTNSAATTNSISFAHIIPIEGPVAKKPPYGSKGIVLKGLPHNVLNALNQIYTLEQ